MGVLFRSNCAQGFSLDQMGRQIAECPLNMRLKWAHSAIGAMVMVVTTTSVCFNGGIRTISMPGKLEACPFCLQKLGSSFV
ncbi:unnamed protein product [Ilex paraguariensis]|uniref:Uncharacterized protein n=1 Tax=Ilex paraguariensis TaxID=185542 RepID=A0ABC8R4K9_9AQUA